MQNSSLAPNFDPDTRFYKIKSKNSNILKFHEISCILPFKCGQFSFWYIFKYQIWIWSIFILNCRNFQILRSATHFEANFLLNKMRPFKRSYRRIKIKILAFFFSENIYIENIYKMIFSNTNALITPKNNSKPIF